MFMNGSAGFAAITSLAVLFGFACSTAHGGPVENLARKARISVSSTRDPYVKEQAIDGDMTTSWSTAWGETSGQWLRLDWDEPQQMAGVVLYQTGRYVQSVDVQVDINGTWKTVGSTGSGTAPPILICIPFEQVTGKSMKLNFAGGAAFFDVEVCRDSAAMQQATDGVHNPEVFVAGDTRGGLIGVVSGDSGLRGLREANVKVTGSGPLGPWHREARTGENGLFRIALPPAVTGAIQVTVDKGDVHAGTTVDSTDISQRLTPLPVDRVHRISLSGQWDFAVDPPQDFPSKGSVNWSKIKVPAHWEMEGFTAETGRAVYHRAFDIPREWADKRIQLRTDAVYSHADVWVNGKRVGGHEGGATPFELDITDAARPGESNEITVLVTARSKAGSIDNASFFAYFELAGIWQPIEVFCVEPTFVSHCAIDTTFDAGYRDANLAVDLDVRNDQAKPVKDALLKLRLFDPKGREVRLEGLSTHVSLDPWDRKSVRLGANIPAPQQWNAEQPRLYRLVAELSTLGQEKRVVEQRFGFRQIEVKGRTVTLNGKPLKLRGVTRLEAHPLTGRALTPDVNRLDAEMIKAANFNAVRACIFPPHPDFLDCTDDKGLYIENEGPSCWGGNVDDLRFVPLYMGIMSEFVERDRNHPSVIDWSICNESSFGPVFAMSARLVKETDPSRLVTASWDDGSLAVGTMHHPITLDRIRETTAGWSRPAFFDEVITVFHGWEDLALFLDIDPGMRDYWVVGLPEIERAINAGENQLGAMQFAWCDDAFLVPGRQIGCWRRDQPPIRYTESVYKLPGRGLLGDVAWGTVDGWRRPRPELWLSKKIYSPVQIEEKPLAIPDAGDPIVVPVENWNQFANLDQYLCKWRMGSEKGEARANAAPMGRGTLVISASRRPTPDDILVLEFYDERSRMVDGYRLAFKPHTIQSLPNSGKPARIVEQGGYLDSASAVRLVGRDSELAYDRTSGQLYRALAGKENVLFSGPALHLQKSPAPMEPFPSGSSLKLGRMIKSDEARGLAFWQFKSADYRTEGAQAVLNWNGSYGSEFTGGYQIRMDDAGDAEIRYEFTYSGPNVWVREIGLQFELPTDFDTLEWDRRAEYSYYPDDHIGRPVGKAVAHPNVPQTVPAGDRPYGLDDHPWGCNDFRSTKRNIYTATLTNKQGQGVRVISDGTQHVRASVGLHEALLNVLDYYGGSAWTYAGGFHYGAGHELATGEVLKGTVRLQLLGGNASSR